MLLLQLHMTSQKTRGYYSIIDDYRMRREVGFSLVLIFALFYNSRLHSWFPRHWIRPLISFCFVK